MLPKALACKFAHNLQNELKNVALLNVNVSHQSKAQLGEKSQTGSKPEIDSLKLERNRSAVGERLERD